MAHASSPPTDLLDPALDPPAALERFRRFREDFDRRARSWRRAGVTAVDLVRGRAEHVDRVLVAAWCRCGLDDEARAALVAVGGYGRAELHPCSDIDFMVLLERAPDEATIERIRELITFLWDVGLEVGHSVRTVADCVEEATADVTVATNLIESRLIRGPDDLFEAMRAATGADRIWSSRAFFEAKWAEQRARHHRFHDTSSNLEPNVKEGPGGLRDIQMVGWVAKRHFDAGSLHELVDHGFLTESEHADLIEGQSFLWHVRLVLHELAGRREDRLLFDHQRRLAGELGYHDDDANLAVEQFMKRYYRTITELSRLNEMLLELFQEAILHGDAATEVVRLNRRFQIVNGFVEVTGEDVFRRYPFALLELFLLVQQHPQIKGVRASTIRLVRDHRYLIDDTFRADIRARSLFLEIFKQPRGITHELRRMNRYGVLAAYLPVFARVVGQMQYDLFHAYTVDEHSIMVVRNLRRFTVPDGRAELPHCTEVFDRIPKPWLLYIAGLFHDIGKGGGGDHSEIGESLAEAFCVQHGLGRYDSHLVAWLVRHHLLMSTTAQRRDISDPQVVAEFAARVGDRTHLSYLYILTVADIRGTNPTLWNDWKDTLLRDLFLSTQSALRRGLENPIDREELIEETQRDALARLDGIDDVARRLWATLGDDYFLRHTADEVAWHTRAIVESHFIDLPLVLLREGRGATELFVYAPDRKSLFATTTAALGRLGLNIAYARIITADNAMTLDSYVVLETDGTPVRGADRIEEIKSAVRAALRGPEDARRAHEPRRPRRQLRHFVTPTQVTRLDDPHHAGTVIEVVAGDRPGLLARIGWVLADAGIRLENAKIATYGERAEDIFYITDDSGAALDETRIAALGDLLREAIDA